MANIEQISQTLGQSSSIRTEDADSDDVAVRVESGQICLRWLAPLLAVLVVMGCAGQDHARLQTALLRADFTSSVPSDYPVDYHVGVGDVLALRFSEKAEWNGSYPVLPHGCIVLPALGAMQVSGHTTEEVAELLRDSLGESAGLVFVEVERYESQPLYLIGEVQGGSRAIAYQGPETIVQALRRAGGLTPDADPTAISVVRAFGDNGGKETLQVNLSALLLRDEHQYNIHLRPYDRIIVPRNPWACLRSCLPSSWVLFSARWSSVQNGNGLKSRP